MIVLCSCNKKIETTHGVIQNITESVYASGKVKSKDQYEVFAQVGGVIQQVHVENGDLVHKGDPLITLIDETPRLNTENARIAASYQSVDANRDKLNEALVNINLAREKLQNDSLLIIRQQHLWVNGIGSRNELDQRELAVKNSMSAYQTAKLRYNQLKQQLEFSALQSRKILQISSSTTGDYVVRSNQDGKVYNISKKPGEIINPQQPFAIIGNAGNFILELQVDEYDVSKIRLGQKAIVSMDSYKGQVFEGTITKIDPIMNDRTRAVIIEAVFTKQPRVLLPNLTVEANILISQKEKALIIPRNYLVDEAYVVLKNGEKRKIITGLKDYQRVEVVDGLSAEDIIKKPVQ
jgi:RND family efflux transporter MFP subunit